MAPGTTPSPHQITDRLSWLWLVIGGGLAAFVGAQTMIPIAAWLAPIFLVRFARTQRAYVGLPLIGVVMFLAWMVAFRSGFMPTSLNVPIICAGIAVAYVAAYAIDRLLYRRLTGLAQTLVFPLASTTIGFLATFGNAVGTAGVETYSQLNPSLLQIVSVFGLWGIVFLMSWLASVVNAAWERGFNLGLVKWPVGVFAGIALVVMLWGGARLAFFAPTSNTVRVASIVSDRDLSAQSKGMPLTTPQERAASRAQLDPLNNDLFDRTIREAQAGAKIVAWSEGTARVLKEDEATFLNRAQGIAKQQGIYLQLGVSFILQREPALYRDKAGTKPWQSENRAIMITPDGTIAWNYEKTKITPGDPEKGGPGIVPTLDTPYGKLATIICQDDLFPEMAAQAGRAGADILIVPSNDWEGVAAWHARVSTFRALENGVSIVRPTRQGTSVVVDPWGRTIASKPDYFTTPGDQTLVASVPTRGTRTVYPVLGDIFAYASVAGLVAIALVALLRGRKSRRT